MKHPRPGEYAYLEDGQRSPVTVMVCNGTSALYTEGHVPMLRTHQGNLYNSEGDAEWHVAVSDSDSDELVEFLDWLSERHYISAYVMPDERIAYKRQLDDGRGVLDDEAALVREFRRRTT